MNRARRHSGFTLLELVLVMLIICIVLAIAAPSLRGWSLASRVRGAGDEFLAMTRFARTNAIAQSTTHRLIVDPAARKYAVLMQQGETFVRVPSAYGREMILPENCQISLADWDAQKLDYIDFYPTGRCVPAVVKLVGENETVQIACPSPAEGFSLVNDEVAR